MSPLQTWNGRIATYLALRGLFPRPLTKEGVAKTEQAVEGLKKIGVELTHLPCSSPLTRTQHTAALVKNILMIQSDIAIIPELGYDQSPLFLFPVLQTLPSDAVVLRVGHEPHLGQTASLMLFGQHLPSLSFNQTGSACIVFHQDAMIEKGLLEW